MYALSSFTFQSSDNHSVSSNLYGLRGCFFTPTKRSLLGLDLILLSFLQAGEFQLCASCRAGSLKLTSYKRSLCLRRSTHIACVSLCSGCIEYVVYLLLHWADEHCTPNRLLQIVYTDGAPSTLFTPNLIWFNSTVCRDLVLHLLDRCAKFPTINPQLPELGSAGVSLANYIVGIRRFPVSLALFSAKLNIPTHPFPT